jgi:hypothetical protein
LLRYLSRAGVAGMVELDEDPRRRRRGLHPWQCSGGERRQQTCARASVKHRERAGTINWKKTHRVTGNRRGQWRRRRRWIPAIVGREMCWTRGSMDGSGSFTGVM